MLLTRTAIKQLYNDHACEMCRFQLKFTDNIICLGLQIVIN